MIFGSYPCCGADLCFAMPDVTPKYLPEECPSCGARVWHVLSRVESISFTESEFLERYEANHNTKTVTDKSVHNPSPLSGIERIIGEKLRDLLMQQLLYGDAEPSGTPSLSERPD